MEFPLWQRFYLEKSFENWYLSKFDDHHRIHLVWPPDFISSYSYEIDCCYPCCNLLFTYHLFFDVLGDVEIMILDSIPSLHPTHLCCSNSFTHGS